MNYSLQIFTKEKFPIQIKRESQSNQSTVRKIYKLKSGAKRKIGKSKTENIAIKTNNK